jgi:UDP:flavonoid glycosyltransferase YjiC (YdhE family)
VAYFGFPARSHTVPSLALIGKLAERGAAVDYYSTPAWRAAVESAGARFIAYRASCEVATNPAPAMSVNGYVSAIAALASELNPELADAARGADVVIFDASACWGHATAQAAGAPAAAFATTFAFTRPMLQMMGVRDPAHLAMLTPAADLKIICTSREFQPAGHALNDSYLFAGPLLEHRPRAGAVVTKTTSRPLAYVSLGTLFNRDRDLLLKISQTLSDAGYEVIVALGGNDSANTASWPPNVRAIPFADQISALQLADLAVTHAGMASMSEIVACGVPAIAIPQAVDQFLVAKRAASLGAAVIVDSASAIGPALVRIQTNAAAMRAAARRIADSFSKATPIDDIADRVLALTGRSKGFTW